MADMLVKLYQLPPLQPALESLAAHGVEVRLARVGEDRAIGAWIGRHFSPDWANGVAYAIGRSPCSLFIAIEKQPPDAARASLYDLPAERLVGFACYDTSNRGMFGPIGVQPSHERRGIGRALLLSALHAMWADHYAYAVIGWAGPVEWYARAVDAVLIPGSEPGPFRGPLV